MELLFLISKRNNKWVVKGKTNPGWEEFKVSLVERFQPA